MCLWCCWKEVDEHDLMKFIWLRLWIQNVRDIDF